MKIIIDNEENIARRAARRYVELLREKPDAILGGATGSTPLGLYAELARLCKAGEISFARARSFNLDEYVGLDGSHDQSYRYFMNENLFKHIDIDLANTRVPDGINTAINENRKVTFRYFDWTVSGEKAFRRDGAAYLTNPVALCVDRHYYLVAYDTATRDYRHYRVDRIAGLTVSDQARDPLPRAFDLGPYVKSIFDMYNGRTVTVRLQFDRSLINAVIDRFGAKAPMHAIDEAHFTLTAPVEVGPTFFGWLFQFGTQAKLLSPDEVKAEFTDYYRGVLSQYE